VKRKETEVRETAETPGWERGKVKKSRDTGAAGCCVYGWGRGSVWLCAFAHNSFAAKHAVDS
jgi:hypothetical protein